MRSLLSLTAVAALVACAAARSPESEWMRAEFLEMEAAMAESGATGGSATGMASSTGIGMDDSLPGIVELVTPAPENIRCDHHWVTITVDYDGLRKSDASQHSDELLASFKNLVDSRICQLSSDVVIHTVQAVDPRERANLPIANVAYGFSTRFVFAASVPALLSEEFVADVEARGFEAGGMAVAMHKIFGYDAAPTAVLVGNARTPAEQTTEDGLCIDPVTNLPVKPGKVYDAAAPAATAAAAPVEVAAAASRMLRAN